MHTQYLNHKYIYICMYIIRVYIYIYSAYVRALRSYITPPPTAHNCVAAAPPRPTTAVLHNARYRAHKETMTVRAKAVAVTGAGPDGRRTVNGPHRRRCYSRFYYRAHAVCSPDGKRSREGGKRCNDGKSE